MGRPGHCDFEWTESELSGKGASDGVLSYSHHGLKFVSPEGQCDNDVLVTLTVAGQVPTGQETSPC